MNGANLGRDQKFGTPRAPAHGRPTDDSEDSDESIADLGRGNDSQLSHTTPGELMLPPELLLQNPQLARIIGDALQSMGVDPAQYIAGSGQASINPLTGLPEYGFGSFVGGLFKKAKKIVSKVASNPIGAAVLTAVTGGALTPVVGSAWLGSALAGTGIGLLGGKSPGEALLGGATAGLGSALTSGFGGALSSKIGLGGTLGSNIGGLSQAAFGASGGLGGTLLRGVANVPLSGLAGAVLTGLAGPALSKSLSPQAPQQVVQKQGAPGQVNQPLPQYVNQTQNPTVPQSPTPGGAGQLPGSPSSLAGAPPGVSYLTPNINRATGAVDYTEAPFNYALSNIRRGSFGSTIFA